LGKLSLNDAFDSKVKIVQTLRRANEPLISHQIAKRSKISPQLVSYQLDNLIKWGIVTTSIEEEKTFYQLQEVYYDNQALEKLSKALLPYMTKISANMDFSQVKGEATEAVVKNLFMFMRLFETEIEKSFAKNKSTAIDSKFNFK
jgi:DNA-binding HxlR family transcriptional regulator